MHRQLQRMRRNVWRMTVSPAFEQGMEARYHDEDEGGLTENPYSYDSAARDSWYEGYRYRDEIEFKKASRSATLQTGGLFLERKLPRSEQRASPPTLLPAALLRRGAAEKEPEGGHRA